MKRSALMFLLFAPFAAFEARAQAPAADKATAEALFGQGRKLMAEKKYREACPKFEASQKLDPGVGTMLNLADCYEKNGQTASAWAQFRDVAAAARGTGSKGREELARQRANLLEPKLSRLTIALGGQQAQIKRDGSPVDPAAIGTAIPVDPGEHVVEATAPGKQKWVTKIDVANAASVTVDVPPLADQGATVAVGAEPQASAGSSSQRTIALGVAAAGVAGLAAGTYFGLRASGDWSDAKTKCPSYPNGCGAEAASLSSDASTSATVSTVAFLVGGVGLAAGALLWFTAPVRVEEKVSVGIGPSGVLVRGRF